MQERLAPKSGFADPDVAVAKGFVERDGLLPIGGTVALEMSPLFVRVKRAANAGALGRNRVMSCFQPSDTIVAAHPPIDEWIHQADIGDPCIAHPPEFVERDADPLL